ncbi:MAG: hypothetical protein QNK85_00745 [Crocinitomicaceae bacterium]
MKKTLLTIVAIVSMALTAIIFTSEANAQESTSNIRQVIKNSSMNVGLKKYYPIIDKAPTTTKLTKNSDNFHDTGGALDDYTNNEFQLWLIEPLNAKSITIDFTAFNIEDEYDNLFIYDGNSIDSPLIGSYTGSSSPGTIISSSGSLLIEFRSDCSNLLDGWVASYSTVLSNFDSAENTDKVVDYSSGLVFRVQIGAFSEPIPKTLMKEFSPIHREKIVSANITRYMTGLFKTSDAAVNTESQIKALGYGDAFTVGYYNGVRIGFNEARKRELVANEMIVDVDY